jgi:hypothetical protein
MWYAFHESGGVWKLRGLRRDFEEGTCPLCMVNEDVKHVLTERKTGDRSL